MANANGKSTAGVQFLAFLKERDGVLVSGQRAMAEAMGWSIGWMHAVLHELARDGLVKLTTRRAGTVVRLVQVVAP